MDNEDPKLFLINKDIIIKQEQADCDYIQKKFQ